MRVVFISCSVLLLLFIKRLLDVIQFEAFIFTDYLRIGEQPNPSLCFSTVFVIIAPHCVVTTHRKFEQTLSMPFVQVLVCRVSELQSCVRFLLSSESSYFPAELQDQLFLFSFLKLNGFTEILRIETV